MLLGYRYEEGPVLRVHAVNWLLRVALLLVVLLLLGLPVLLVGDVDFRWKMMRGGLLDALLPLLSLMALPVMGLASGWYTRVRETLEIDVPGNRAIRRSCNMFGAAEKVEVFALDDRRKLQLRRLVIASRSSGRGPTRFPAQLWLINNDSSEQQLSFETVQIRPGRAKTQAFLQRVADQLGLSVPSDVVELPPPVQQTASGSQSRHRDRSQPPVASRRTKRRNKVLGGAQPSQAATSGGSDSHDAVPAIIRAVMALFGAMLAVYSLGKGVGLALGVMRGVLVGGSLRNNTVHYYYWADDRLAFLFQLMSVSMVVLILGAAGWGCLRVAMNGSLPKQP